MEEDPSDIQRHSEGCLLRGKFIEWWIQNIQRKDVLNEFLKTYPNVPVTYAGGFSLGMLNMGNDKVRITKEFGDLLISKIENSNK